MRKHSAPAQRRRPPAIGILTALACLLFPAGHSVMAQEATELDAAAQAELERFASKVERLKIIEIPAEPEEMELIHLDGITIQELRTVHVDDDPPKMGERPAPYPENQTDTHPPGQAPYEASLIPPFRMKEFVCEFSYGGWHNLKMFEYAATHGFSVIAPYVMKDRGHFPEGTRWLQWGDFVDWRKYFETRQIPWGRYDKLAERNVLQDLLDAGKVWKPGAETLAMLDVEHGSPLSPEELRKQDWYPKDAAAEEKQAFEKKYYDGYAQTYIAPIEALHKNGWQSAGIYPQPWGSGWYALLDLAHKGLSGEPDPNTYWPWLTYGPAMVAAQDVLYPDIYVYYWSAQNVAYTLARQDFDMKLLQTLPAKKPYRPCLQTLPAKKHNRPYFFLLLHDNSDTPTCWNEQPMPNEDARAMFALTFFTGSTGVVLWNWSDTGNHHAAPPLWLKKPNTPSDSTWAGAGGKQGGIGADVMLKDGFDLRPEGAAADAPPTHFKRYDILAVMEVDEAGGTVKFQHIDPRVQKGGERLDPKKPAYLMKKDELLPHLRPLSEPVSGAIEGLALVKPLEYILKHGEVKIDVPALDQFAKTLPIVRRVKLGPIHILATYDPCVVHDGAAPRQIVLKDFDGQRGLTLKLHADDQLRIYVLKRP
ncbi:MAG: hypothetical protein NTW87_13985 [Planctomycetota bacterium]|nr:hypothetical protein [Planctomycetota bacterium]